MFRQRVSTLYYHKLLHWLRVLSEVCLRLLLGHRSLCSQRLGLLNDGSFRCVVAGSFRQRSLCGQRLGHLDHRSLGRIVTGLFQERISSLVNTTCCTGAEHFWHWRFACAHCLRHRSITLRPESWSVRPPQPLMRGSRAVSTAVTSAESLVD